MHLTIKEAVFLRSKWQIMRRIAAVAVLCLTLAPLGAGQAAANVIAKIDLSKQRMYVTVNGAHYATWKVSTGRKGFRTPTGSWRPKWLTRMHYSRKYDDAPMPYSIFFKGGFAIHGTNSVRRLGRPASHGCIRLRTRNAKKLFNLVKRHGSRNTRIRIKR